MKVRSLQDVVEFQQCTGCGGCSYVLPEVIKMVDIEEAGMRPKFQRSLAKAEERTALDICPGAGLTHKVDEFSDFHQPELKGLWGPVIDVYEGYATSGSVRMSGSSGGVLTAFSLFGVESGTVQQVISTSMDVDDPIKNRTIVAETNDEILKSAGSRYSPSAPLAKLSALDSKSKAIVIGKPCDIAALKAITNRDQVLGQKVDLSLAFFCAGVPSTSGNRQYVSDHFEGGSTLESLKFRGDGWPGEWEAKEVGSDRVVTESYADSWGELQKYRQWRCYICPDHSGEFSDISVGDPWYRQVKDEEAGASLIVVRSERGRRYLEKAVEAGYITLIKKDTSLIARSQPNLIEARGALWGRLLALKLMGVPVPVYKGFSLFKFWMLLTNRQKLSSVLGTVRRVYRKRLKVRQSYGE